ncbi:MAG: 50S ribosomal protein L24 [Erysipelotrichaceae bacterium]|jgi:large subunit ribosomal protein L24|nr:50S ribosomal protein L24 [Erysipelotrichaceae bacterium]
MKIKRGDKVIVIAGADKGKVGTVQKAFPKLNKVVIDGVNVRKKHQKPTQGNPDGSIVEIYAPIHVSNVAVYDEKTKKGYRVGYDVTGDKKVRVMKKVGTKLD